MTPHSRVHRLSPFVGLLYRAVRTLFSDMVSFETPDPDPAIERVECYPVEGQPGRIVLQDSERPLAWIESNISVPVAGFDGGEGGRTPHRPYNHPEK